MNKEALDVATNNLVRRLLDARNADGHWEGNLASSPLSTATAVTALCLADRKDLTSLIGAGIRWLAAHQNPDGGWGDTARSMSNISTTALVWAALAVAAPGLDPHAEVRAEAWLTRCAGSLDPGDLAAAITRRYGNDR